MDALFGALTVFYFVGAVALITFVLVANKQLPESKIVAEQFGPTYWGHYRGTASMDEESAKIIEAKVPTEQQVGMSGSTSYARGG
jgi:hypothetical protein